MGDSVSYPQDVLRRLQLVELDMLRNLDRVCRELELSYWLDSGTCLGAVRHGGFIPWDDDIDIGMPLDDYLRFQEQAPKLLPDSLTMHTCENTPHMPVLWTKVFLKGTRFMERRDCEAGIEQGIFIDIFPYINVDVRPKVSERQHRHFSMCQNLAYLNVYAHPATYNYSKNARLAALACVFAHNTVARPFTPQRMSKRAQRLMKVEQPGSEWRPVYAFASLKKNLPGELLLPVRPISFEDETFMGPADPEGYLTALYGPTFMELPPEDKRHTHMPDILDFGDGINVMDGLR